MSSRKSSLRKKLQKRIKRISSEKRFAKSVKIKRKLLSEASFIQAKKILCYMALPTEVETRSLIQAAWRRGKKIYIPRIVQKEKHMTFYAIHNFSRDVEKGAYGIEEPKVVSSRRGKAGEMDLVIVPGVAFTKSGARLGRGGGYFDRLLKKIPAVKIGVAFREQIVKSLPMKPHDVRMDKVVTDS
ncbi:MAG: 5-formyltetrahydrofolate cyclo-ligase [Candidatus Omnitrophica bacterium]|nr:5-formyltetrahydrofolate cyclo-ligase [Candidatus Omnitrophota bacterium]